MNEVDWTEILYQEVIDLGEFEYEVRITVYLIKDYGNVRFEVKFLISMNGAHWTEILYQRVIDLGEFEYEVRITVYLRGLR